MKEGYTVQGEVLRVVQASPSMWAWPPHDFVKVSKPKKSKPKKSAVRDFAVSIPGVTGDKYQFPDPGHCKYTVRTWTMYLGKTQLVHHKYI